MERINLLLVLCGIFISANAQLIIKDELRATKVFDYDLYNRVIDRFECEKQVTYLRRNDSGLFGRFLDAGLKIPRGIYQAVLTDLGNYFECIGIDEQVRDMRFEGKYCLVKVPFNQTFKLPFLEDNQIDFTNKKIVHFKSMISEVQPFVLDDVEIDPQSPLAFSEFRLAVCIPKQCTPQEWVKNVLFDVNLVGFQFEEEYCRLPNDKPWVAVDYVAIGLLSLIGLITTLSTIYDINHIVIQKKDPMKAKIFGRMFSVYTNTRRLLTFNNNANALDCLDGIRSISMMWVIIGHAFSMYNFNANLLDALDWLTSGDAVIISTGLFTVDTFFLMAGLLLVYTTVGKLSGFQLIKRLHQFYLNRLLRMFPLLATLVLLEASVFHRVGDGPYWNVVGRNADRCRTFWWSTLLHIQNYVNPDHICIQHSWYIAIDIQLHIVSPIVLFWVLNKNRKAAWASLISAVLAIHAAATVWNFMKAMPSTNMSLLRLEDQALYMNNYYMNTLTRGAPFFIGMIVGYVLNIQKGKEVILNRGFVITSWIISLAMIALCFYMSYVIMQLDWDNQVGDSLFNSFMRSIWAIALSWMIYACVKGYGGPINWLLSLRLWKLPARISFAMYLYHYSLMFITAGMQLQPTYFSIGARFFDFIAFFALTFVLSFFLTVVIDAPFSVLIKMIMEGGGQRRPRQTIENGGGKPGLVTDKKPSDIEKTVITTLEKDIPALEKNGTMAEQNGAILEKNGALDKIEEAGETPSKTDISKF